MRNEQHYRRMLKQNPNAGVGFTLDAAMVYAARYGTCEPSDHGTDEWKTIARSGRGHLRFELEVSDNGVGLSPVRPIQSMTTLGMSLIRSLSDQLEADYANIAARANMPTRTKYSRQMI